MVLSQTRGHPVKDLMVCSGPELTMMASSTAMMLTGGGTRAACGSPEVWETAGDDARKRCTTNNMYICTSCACKTITQDSRKHFHERQIRRQPVKLLPVGAPTRENIAYYTNVFPEQ